jgi:hypothetical protein
MSIINSKKINDLDYEPIIDIINSKKSNDTGDLYQLSSKFYDILNLKISLLLFLTYCILNTDVFIEKGLNKVFNNVYDINNDKFTEKGIIISGIILSVCYIIYDLLNKKNII